MFELIYYRINTFCFQYRSANMFSDLKELGVNRHKMNKVLYIHNNSCLFVVV